MLLLFLAYLLLAVHEPFSRPGVVCFPDPDTLPASFSSFLSKTTTLIHFKFGMQLPYIEDYKNSSLHVNQIVHVTMEKL